MNLDIALKIMGLNRNFTEPELKAAYKRLIMKWHPDLCKDTYIATEKTQEINLARDYLSSYLKINRTSTVRSNTSYSSNPKREQKSRVKVAQIFCDILNTYIRKSVNVELDEEAELVKKEIEVILLKYAFDTAKYDDDDIDKVNEMYLLCVKKVNDLLIDYIHSYCNKRGFRYRDTQSSIIVEYDYIILIKDTIYSIFDKLSKIKKKESLNDILVKSYVEKLIEDYLENETNGIVIELVKEYIKLFKIEASSLDIPEAIDACFSKYNYLIQKYAASYNENNNINSIDKDDRYVLKKSN